MMMKIFGRRRVLSFLGICATVLVFVLHARSFHPQEFLDFYQDDSIYFTTAKALASGQGYIIPSFPGVLPQTKYPVLYPLILAVVWRIDPAFPRNLGLATDVSLAVAASYLVLGYLLLRRLGASSATSLLVAAAIALHPGFTFLSGELLSDYLFAALILASALAADEMCGEGRALRWGILTGITLGLAMLARSAAIGAAAGLVVYCARRRCWRPLCACAAVSAAIFSVVNIVVRSRTPSYVPAGVGIPPVGFQHILLYYSSYLRMWLLSIPNVSVLVSMISSNLRKLMLAPGNYFVMDGYSVPSSLIAKATALLVSAISFGGVLRWSTSSRHHAILYIFCGTVPVLVLWNYAFYDRFLLPFVPLILFGILVELRRVLSLLVSGLRNGDAMDRVVAVSLAFVLVAVTSLAVSNYRNFNHILTLFSLHRAALNRERREAYEWLSTNTPQTARVISYEDGLVYLYTGRQAVRPVAISTDCYYQPERQKCESDFSEMGTWVAYAGTRYWLSDPDELEFEGGRRFRPEVQKLIANLKARMCPVFVSSGGQVIIYDTASLISSQASNCPSQPPRLH